MGWRGTSGVGLGSMEEAVGAVLSVSAKGGGVLRRERLWAHPPEICGPNPLGKRKNAAFPTSRQERPVQPTHVLGTLLSRFAPSPRSRHHCPRVLLPPTPPAPISCPSFARMVYCTQIPLVSSFVAAFTTPTSSRAVCLVYFLFRKLPLSAPLPSCSFPAPLPLNLLPHISQPTFLILFLNIQSN